MTKEEKELLFIDVSARLPYHPYALFDLNKKFDGGLQAPIIGMVNKGNTGVIKYNQEFYAYGCITPFSIDEFRIYLKRMSSMTMEEKKDILRSLNINGDIDNEGNLLLGAECNIITLKVCKKYIGELNKRMFDVCHMIEKGLALEAPKGMYNIKE